MKPASCFGPAHILLPREDIPLEKWGCVACDQFTSDRAYWERADAAVGSCPSTLRLILPEVYLGDKDAAQRVERIHAAMDAYSRDVLTRAVDGFVYVERTEQSGRVRQGLVGKIDLEAYSYEKGSRPAIRPSERTVTERIPPRMTVRRGAALETPHVMMLADDPGCILIEPIGAHKSALKKLYEGELMQGGGHIGGAHTAVDAKLRVHGRREPAGRQLPQLNRVVDGLVAVARRNDRAAERCQCADARQQADGGPADEVPAPPRAVQRRRAGHGVGQNAVRVVQVVRAVDLGQVPGIAAQPRCGRHPPLMPGHVQRVTRRGEGF